MSYILAHQQVKWFSGKGVTSVVKQWYMEMQNITFDIFGLCLKNSYFLRIGMVTPNF